MYLNNSVQAEWKFQLIYYILSVTTKQTAIIDWERLEMNLQTSAKSSYFFIFCRIGFDSREPTSKNKIDYNAGISTESN